MIVEQSVVFSQDHPALPGHFPGDPMIPGVVLLDEAATLAQRSGPHRITGIRVAKFKSPLRPGMTCLIHLSSREDGALDVKCTVEESTILTAIFDCEPGA